VERSHVVIDMPVLYWVLVSLEANIIGYWILGAFLGIVLTLHTHKHAYTHSI